MPSKKIDKKLEQGKERLNSEDFEGSLVFFNEVINSDPKNEDAYYFKGFSLIQLGKYEDAIKNFDKALELNLEDVNALNF